MTVADLRAELERFPDYLPIGVLSKDESRAREVDGVRFEGRCLVLVMGARDELNPR